MLAFKVYTNLYCLSMRNNDGYKTNNKGCKETIIVNVHVL